MVTPTTKSHGGAHCDQEIQIVVISIHPASNLKNIDSKVSRKKFNYRVGAIFPRKSHKIFTFLIVLSHVHIAQHIHSRTLVSTRICGASSATNQARSTEELGVAKRHPVSVKKIK